MNSFASMVLSSRVLTFMTLFLKAKKLKFSGSLWLYINSIYRLVTNDLSVKSVQC